MDGREQLLSGVGQPLSHESIAYRLLDRHNASIGGLIVDYATNLELHVELSWSISGIDRTAELSLDLQTLELRPYEVGSITRYPWGIGRWLPQSHSGFMLDWNDPRDVLPIGLQAWAVESPDGWRVDRTYPCERECGFNTVTPADLHVEAHGRPGAFLPDWFTVSVNAYFIRAVALDTPETSATRLDLQPTQEPQWGTEPPCGYALCEPDGWPVEISLQSGLQAVERDPNWILWPTDVRQPWVLTVFSPHYLDSEALLLADSVLGVYSFEGSDDRQDFFTRAVQLPTGSYGPSLVESAQTAPKSSILFGQRTWGDPVLSLDAVLAGWVDQLGTTLGDVVLVQQVAWPDVFNPDLRARYSVLSVIDTPDGRISALGSAVDGQLQQTSAYEDTSA